MDRRDLHEAVLQVVNYEEAGRQSSPKRDARETKLHTEMIQKYLDALIQQKDLSSQSETG